MMDPEMFYMQASDLAEEILASNDALVSIEALSNELLAESDSDSDSDGEASDDFFLLSELKMLLKLDDEVALMESLRGLFQQMMSSTIMRPYDQRFTTEDGCNRVTMRNFAIKYPVGIFEKLFRFKQEHIVVLLEALQIPESLSFEGYVTSGVEALLLHLRRLSSLVRYQDISMEFDLLPQFLSQVFNGICLRLFRDIGPHIRRINHGWLTDRSKLESWSRALQEKGCPLENTVGWADGTHVPICKPVRGQRCMYCGHHKTHCLKIQVMTVPSGLMLGFGPFDGNTHDSLAADIVGLDDLLMEHLTMEDGTQFNLFLDAGYRLGHSMITPFRVRRDMTQDEMEWNRRMSRQRVAVEWSIGRIKNLFKMLTYKKNLKALMSPVATYFFLAMHLTNINSILYGNEVAQYFDVEVETLEEYLTGFRMPSL